MVRAVVADETQFNLIEARLSSSRVHVQVGLAIGKPGSNKDSIFTLIPTPLNPDGKTPASLSDDSRPDNKKKSKPSQSLQIDVDWVAEHARQVSKMLVGGMYVVGIYIWGAETIFKTSSLVLYQTIKEVSRATKEYGNVEAEERLAVHISYSPKRLSCWSCSVDESFTPTSFRPCDLKTIKLLSTLQTFTSIQNIKLRLPLLKHEVQSSNGMKSILLKAVELLSEHLQSTKAIYDESLISENCEVGTGENREIEFLLPFGNMMSLPDGKGESDEQVFGLLNFRGTVFAQAYLFPRETLFQAIEELKGIAMAFAFMTTRNQELEWQMWALRVLPVFGLPAIAGCLFYSCSRLFKGCPLQFDLLHLDATAKIPKLILNPFSWTKVSNIIFLDSPAGTGFSYYKNLEDFETGDIKAVNDIYTFLRKWYEEFPEFTNNELYIGGDSYSGLVVPVLSLLIHHANEDGILPSMNLKDKYELSVIWARNSYIRETIEAEPGRDYEYRRDLDARVGGFHIYKSAFGFAKS